LLQLIILSVLAELFVIGDNVSANINAPSSSLSFCHIVVPCFYYFSHLFQVVCAEHWAGSGMRWCIFTRDSTYCL